MNDIVKLGECEDSNDLPGHPIPALGSIDVCGVKKQGGADLVIVIAKPLQSDEESLTRLLDKIEGYLRYIQSDEFRKEIGEPHQKNTNIIVKIHHESCMEAFQLLEKSKAWVEENNASLQIEKLDPLQ